MKQKKFWEAVSAVKEFARMAQEDRELFHEIRMKLRNRVKIYVALKALLGDNITEELEQKINARLEMNANAYSAIKDFLWRDRLDEEIFAEARRIVFKVENGDANTFLTEITEMERFFPLTRIYGKLDSNQLGIANVPIIRTVNGGEYVCRSASPTVASEIYYMCEGLFKVVQEMRKEDTKEG